MLREIGKRISSNLPKSWRRELRRLSFARDIRRGEFFSEEGEFALLAELIQQGDWVIDVGANIGHYTARFSTLAGPSGRVFALEPVPETFYVLASNLQMLGHNNVTLLNVALSDTHGVVSVTMPTLESGIPNFYQARLANTGSVSDLQVYTITLDDLRFAQRIALVKIDVEGHELPALQGMRNLIRNDLPHIILETYSDTVIDEIRQYGYDVKRLPNSPNVLALSPKSKRGFS